MPEEILVSSTHLKASGNPGWLSPHPMLGQVLKSCRGPLGHEGPCWSFPSTMSTILPLSIYRVSVNEPKQLLGSGATVCQFLLTDLMISNMPNNVC